MNYTKSRFILIKNILSIIFFILIINLIIPFSPYLPSTGLDPSWVLGLDFAISNQLLFGKELIFTFGPYASVITKSYNPATVPLMYVGCTIFAISYSIILITLLKRLSLTMSILLFLFIASFIHFIDFFFFSYSLLLAIFVYFSNFSKKNFLISNTLLLVILFSILGLFPLTKGSFVINSISTILFSLLFFLYKKKYIHAIISFLFPVISLIFFWIYAEQPLQVLPEYFMNILYIISGYSEAMSLPGNLIQIKYYLITSIAICFILFFLKIKIEYRLFMFMNFSVFLFISFKAGFTRHDAHAVIAASSIGFAGLILNIIAKQKYSYLVIVFSMFTWFYIYTEYFAISYSSTIQLVQQNLFLGFSSIKKLYNKPEDLKSSYLNTINTIKTQSRLPVLNGTTDIYSFNQAILLSSQNKWVPRPIFQSYAAYNKKLIEINEFHLKSNRAPDNILYKIEPIDNRLPAIEEGLSWATLLGYYYIDKKESDYLLLKKKPKPTNYIYKELYSQKYKMGEIVPIPNNNLIFAEIDFKPTIVGKLLGTLYKPSFLMISIQLKDNTKVYYRLISSMTQTKFLLSPLVQDNDDFSQLYNYSFSLHQKKVKNFIITQVENGSTWNIEFYIKFYEIVSFSEN